MRQEGFIRQCQLFFPFQVSPKITKKYYENFMGIYNRLALACYPYLSIGKHTGASLYLTPVS